MPTGVLVRKIESARVWRNLSPLTTTRGSWMIVKTSTKTQVLIQNRKHEVYIQKVGSEQNELNRADYKRLLQADQLRTPSTLNVVACPNFRSIHKNSYVRLWSPHLWRCSGRESEALWASFTDPVSREWAGAYTCFKCGSQNIFSMTKQVRSRKESTSVFNECLYCSNRRVPKCRHSL